MHARTHARTHTHTNTPSSPPPGAPPSPPPEVDEAVMIVSGDRVKVSVDVESFKRSQEDHGGWNHLMNQV